ncbi:MAG: SDR family oxidoreductase [Polyangiaceae bacterium]
MKILVTGATGNIGGKVANRLIERGLTPTLFTRDLRRGTDLFGGRASLSEGDLGDASALRRVFEGIDALFLVSTGADLARRDQLVAQVARTSGVRRIVKLSSLDAASSEAHEQSDGVRMGAWHSAGEVAIRESGLRWCFLRPTGFMSNALAWTFSIKQEGMVKAPTGDGRIAMVHPDDIADVAVKALLEPELEGKVLELTGPEALSYAEMISILAKASQRSIDFSPITDEEAHARMLRVGMDPPVATALVALWRDVRLGRSGLVTSTVEGVLGRPPRSFRDWARENASAFQ